jgi:gallate decarboxylase subunit D
MITFGEGKYKVNLERKELGDDLVYILSGGEKPHIGGIVISQPAKETKVIRIKGHYDVIVLKPIAEAASGKFDRKVVALGGVHVDNASQKEINRLVKNCKELVKYI